VDRPPRALLVDFGGVLTSSVWPAFAGACAARGLAPQAIKRLFRSNPALLAALREVETGAADEAAFAAALAARLGVDPDGLLDDVLGRLEPDREMLALVRAARAAGHPTGLVSNSLGIERYDRALLAELFDAVVLSGEVGLHKPQEAIFRLAATRVDRPAQACVFVDDLEENCRGAVAAGMRAVRHRSTAETVPAVRALLLSNEPVQEDEDHG